MKIPFILLPDQNARKAFTLLELIIVIIIVGVLASLALPRFFRVIERARAVEAVTELGVIRQAIERCYMMRGGTSYAQCQPGNVTWDRLQVDDPSTIPNAHFDYSSVFNCSGPGTMGLILVAVRNSVDLNMSDSGGAFQNLSLSCGSVGFSCSPASRVFLLMDNANVSVVGCGFYDGIR